MDAARKTVEYFNRHGLLELEAGCIGMDQLDFEQQSHQKNREAEESHARREIWGWEGKNDGNDNAEDDMGGGNRYLGEFTQTPVVYPPSNGLLPLIAGLGLGALPAALLAGYLWARQPEPKAANVDTDSTYRVEKWTPDAEK